MLYKVSIPVSDAKVGLICAEPIFFRNDDGNEVMLVRADAPLTDTIIKNLKLRDVSQVMIFSDEPPPVKTPKQYDDLPAEPVPAPPVESVISNELHEAAMSGIKGLFDLASGSSVVTAYQVVKELNNVVDQLVETMSSEQAGMVHIANLKSYDEYTYHHSLSVAVLAIAIGQEMGLSPRELKKLGRSAIMHDIGKVLVPIEVINKPSRLTPEEFDIVAKHSENGASYLKKEGIGDTQLWGDVSCHHEKFDGTGYPNGLRGKDIPLFSRIIAVADVYDALTSYRPYRKPLLPATALEKIMVGVGRIFDFEIVSAFTKIVELYPINTVLTLSNKRVGIVVDNRYSLRPILRMLDDGELFNLADLNNLSLMIEQVRE